MVLDVPNIESDDEEDESASKSEDGDGTIPKKRPKGLGRLHISRLLQMVLQDAQTRLFFKAQSIIQAEIRYYVPKPEDLAYPDKLAGASDTRSLHVSFESLTCSPLPISGSESTLRRRIPVPGKGECQSDFPGQVLG